MIVRDIRVRYSDTQMALILNQSGRPKTPINQSHCFVTGQTEF